MHPMKIPDFGHFFRNANFPEKSGTFEITPLSTCTISKHIYERIMKKINYERTNIQIDPNSQDPRTLLQDGSPIK